MKLINSKLAAAALVIGSASSAMAVQTSGLIAFQFDTGVAGFSTPTKTKVWVDSAALNNPEDISKAITKFTITTPEGVWTSGQFSPSTPPPSGTTVGSPPFWAFGQVEILNGGNTLVFTKDAQLEVPFTRTIGVSTVIAGVNGDYNVDLSTTHISDTFQTISLQDATGATGVWDPVNPVPVGTPEIASTAWLLFGSFGLMGAYQYSQRRSSSSVARA